MRGRMEFCGASASKVQEAFEKQSAGDLILPDTQMFIWFPRALSLRVGLTDPSQHIELVVRPDFIIREIRTKAGLYVLTYAINKNVAEIVGGYIERSYIRRH